MCETSVYRSYKFQPGEKTTLKEGDNLLIITDHSWSADRSLQELLDLNIVVAEIFNIKSFGLSLQCVISSCLQLHYYLSNEVGMRIFPLTREQEDKLSECGIAEVHYREHHYVFGKRKCKYTVVM